MSKLVQRLYQTLLFLACVSMILAFASVLLGIVARIAVWKMQGFDAYAGFAIAMALFLALPETFRHGDHIRVTLFLEHVSARARSALEYWSLGAGLALSVFLAYFACRLVWISYVTGDISPSIDKTPLWLPQIFVALGCIGFAVAFVDTLARRISRREVPPAEGEIAHYD